MKLTEWLDEYRNLPLDEVVRPSHEAEDELADQDLMADPDRMRDTSARWLKRAGRTGYGRPSGF